tara:strand:+ start:755 stop:973 length:219 start_codon:yes stop_codon:yes gene_type:complete
MNKKLNIIKFKSSNCNQLLDAIEMAWCLAEEQNRKYQIVNLDGSIIALPKGTHPDDDSDNAWSSGVLLEITP